MAECSFHFSPYVHEILFLCLDAFLNAYFLLWYLGAQRTSSPPGEAISDFCCNCVCSWSGDWEGQRISSPVRSRNPDEEREHSGAQSCQPGRCDVAPSPGASCPAEAWREISVETNGRRRLGWDLDGPPSLRRAIQLEVHVSHSPWPWDWGKHMSRTNGHSRWECRDYRDLYLTDEKTESQKKNIPIANNGRAWS